MIFLWIVLALVILALAVSYLAFRIACVRGHEYPWEDDAQMQKKIGPSYAALVKGGVDWLRQQRPRDLYLTSYDGRHIFLNTGNGGELMLDAGDLDGGRSHAGQ